MRTQSLFLGLVLALTGCGSGTDGKKADAVAAGDMSANLPMGVPLMAGAVVKSNNNGAAGSGQANAAAVLTTAEPVEAVFEYYTDAMNDAGFGAARETEVGEIRSVTATRDGEMGMITVKPDGGATMVMIVSRREPQGAAR